MSIVPLVYYPIPNMSNGDLPIGVVALEAAGNSGDGVVLVVIFTRLTR
jgi:hypothetical protein